MTTTQETAIRIARALRKQHGYRELTEDLRLDADAMELEPIEPPGVWHAPKPVKEWKWPGV